MNERQPKHIDVTREAHSQRADLSSGVGSGYTNPLLPTVANPVYQEPPVSVFVLPTEYAKVIEIKRRDLRGGDINNG